MDREALESKLAARDDRWSEAIAVGSLAFVETVKNDLGIRATHREVLPADGTYAVREASEPYVRKFTGKNEVLRAENTFFWDETVENAAT
jgi:putative transposase